MSPHGKQAGGQALGQPRPPPSTPRAPDRGLYKPCGPLLPHSPGSSSPGRSLRVAWHPTGAHPSPPAFQGASLPPPTLASQAQKDTGHSARRSLPPLPPPMQRRPGRLPSGCSVTQPRRRRLPCSSAGRDASRGPDAGRSSAHCKPLGAGFLAVTHAHRAASLHGIPLLTRNLGGAVCSLFQDRGERKKDTPPQPPPQFSWSITVKFPHLCSTHLPSPLPSRAGGWRQWR